MKERKEEDREQGKGGSSNERVGSERVQKRMEREGGEREEEKKMKDLQNCIV